MKTNNSDSSWVDSLLATLPQYNIGDDPITDKPFTPEETFAIYPELAQAKQKILQKMNEARIDELDRISQLDLEDIGYYVPDRRKLLESKGE